MLLLFLQVLVYFPVLIIFTNFNAYEPNPGNIFSRAMIAGGNGYLFAGVQRINWVYMSSHLLQCLITRFKVEEVDGEGK